MNKSIQIMSSIDYFNLRSFDLNLLIAFDALHHERSVTKAAERLNIQQPAMSHNLGTLRVLFSDELFVRVGQVMKPTPRALALAQPIRRILEQAQQAITTRETFSPAEQERTFTIGFSSELEVLLMPALAARVQSIAPGIKLLARPAQPDTVHRMLDDSQIDLGIGCFDEGGTRHKHAPLFEQSLMCCFNPTLIDLDVPISKKAYVRLPHALIAQNGRLNGCLDDALRAIDASLNVVLAAPEFLTVLGSAMQAPVIATLPARIVQRYAPLFGLTVSPVPLDLRVDPIAMVWSAHTHQDPASQWLRERVIPLITQVETLVPTAEMDQITQLRAGRAS